MFYYKKKRGNHAEDDIEESEESEETELDFAWIVYVGLQVGYTEKEVKHMYYGKWSEMFRNFRKMHNITIKKELFMEKKIESLIDL